MSASAYIHVARSRPAVTRGSFCRSDPAAALRGLANGGRPASSLLVVALVETHKRILRHIHLAANLEAPIGRAQVFQRFRGENRWDIGYGAHIERHVFAHGTVSARGRSNQDAVLVGQGDAKAVDFELADIFGLGIQLPLNAVEPLVELPQVHDVVDGVHAGSVAHALKLL